MSIFEFRLKHYYVGGNLDNMKYNVYIRKDENIPQQQIDWINANIESISKKENVLFVFQAENEALLITDSGIYISNGSAKRNIRYSEIDQVNISGNVLLELVTINSGLHSIVFVTPVDKAKFFQVLEMLIDNYKNNIQTTFEDTHKIFLEFTVLKYPPKQLQHKLPQVYLKQFGYLDGEQWNVSIFQKDEKFSRQKSIGSFTVETNVFDIESDDDRFPRMFESFNSDLENNYHDMLEDISNNSVISEITWEILVQFTPNMMVRSDYWRKFVGNILNSPNKKNFLDITVSVLTSSFKELQELKKKHFYKVLNEGDVTQSKLNKTLLLFSNYIFYRLTTLDLVILESPEEQMFFTSDNPVNFKANQKEGKMGLYSVDTEIYFPISKKYLAYFHHQDSDLESPLRKLKNKGVYQIEKVLTEDEYNELVKEKIINAADKLIIAPGKMDFRIEE